jgi:DNA uptake protein ComE-like DNA-binding protein
VAAVALASSVSFAAAATASASHTATKPAGGVPAKLDINGASKAQLAKLPGIGEAYSQKIIDGRPYRTKTDLESKKILPKDVYEKIEGMIIAHQK